MIGIEGGGEREEIYVHPGLLLLSLFLLVHYIFCPMIIFPLF